jgi:hypothetical protein
MPVAACNMNDWGKNIYSSVHDLPEAAFHNDDDEHRGRHNLGP